MSVTNVWYALGIFERLAMIYGLAFHIMLLLFSAIMASNSSLEETKKRKIVREGRISRTFGPVTVIRNRFTFQGKAITINPVLAVLFGILNHVNDLQEDRKEYHFQESALEFHIKPDPKQGVPKFTINMSPEIIAVSRELASGEILLSHKIKFPEVPGLDLVKLRWICFLEVKDLRSLKVNIDSAKLFHEIMMAALDYDKSSPEGKYYALRKYLKGIFSDLKHGYTNIRGAIKILNSWRVEKMTQRIPRKYIAELWPELLRYNRRYADGNVSIRWIIHLKFGRLLGNKMRHMFSVDDIEALLNDIIARKSVTELEELISEPGLFKKLSKSSCKRFVRSVRENNYFNNMALACSMIDEFENYYKIEWVRKDILAFLVTCTEAKSYNTAPVKKFLEHLITRWPDNYSKSWFGKVLQTVALFKMHLEESDWLGIGYFTGYLWLFYSKMPFYFLQSLNLQFRAVQKDQIAPYSNLKDAILETTVLLPCFALAQSYHDVSGHVSSVSIVKEMMMAVKGEDDYILARTYFKHMVIAIDFWLQVTSFADDLVEINLQVDSSKICTHCKLAKSLALELFSAFNHVQKIREETEYEPDNLMRCLSRWMTSRVILLFTWSGVLSIPLEEEDFISIIQNDIYGLTYALWAERLNDPSKFAEILKVTDFLLLDDNQALAEFHLMITQIGEPVSSPCCSHNSPRLPARVLEWDAPKGLMVGDLNVGCNIRLLRSYLLLKFGVPYHYTRTNDVLNAGDHVQPQEFESYLNFWLERFCALSCSSHGGVPCVPAYRIVISTSIN